MDQPARCLCRSERRAPPAALHHRGPIGSRPRPEPVAPPRDPACRRSALLAAFGAQHDTVARWKSTQPAGGDQATLTDLPGVREAPCRKCAYPRRAAAQLDGGLADHLPSLWRRARRFPALHTVFRADPADPLLARIGSSAREGELIMDRAFRRRHGGSAHAALMRGLLFPQAPKTTTSATRAARPRLLDLVVPGSEDFFQRLPSENWPCTSRVMARTNEMPSWCA